MFSFPIKYTSFFIVVLSSGRLNCCSYELWPKPNIAYLSFSCRLCVVCFVYFWCVCRLSVGCSSSICRLCVVYVSFILCIFRVFVVCLSFVLRLFVVCLSFMCRLYELAYVSSLKLFLPMGR